jgi:hypothetical protein
MTAFEYDPDAYDNFEEDGLDDGSFEVDYCGGCGRAIHYDGVHGLWLMFNSQSWCPGYETGQHEPAEVA